MSRQKNFTFFHPNYWLSAYINTITSKKIEILFQVPLFILYMVGRDGFEPSYALAARFLTTIVFTTILNVCSLDFLFIFFKIPGIKSLHSEISFLARDYHQLILLRLPRISLVIILSSLTRAANLGFCLKPKTTVCRL